MILKNKSNLKPKVI